ncbi:hypothetical protein JTB14_015113 [Gonioctena quinquepunctata]|nr:hypothetical protein JTB14_015113 [Gonioctena quinquepunctata]
MPDVNALNFVYWLTKSSNLIWNQTLHEDAVEGEMVASVPIFPPEGKTNDDVISCLKITNLNPGDGGLVKTLTGGVFNKRVIAVITSGLSKPLDYSVEIWSDS